MRNNNLNLELSLLPSSNSNLQPTMEEIEERPLQQDHQHQQRHQPMTIFYEDKTWVHDVTELQARTILMLANKEMVKERVRKSLQRFLLNRNNNIQEASSPCKL